MASPPNWADLGLTADEATDLLRALLIWKNWKVAKSAVSNSLVTITGEDNAYRAVDIARKLGLFSQFFEMMQDLPILTVEVLELAGEKDAVTKRKTPTKKLRRVVKTVNPGYIK